MGGGERRTGRRELEALTARVDRLLDDFHGGDPAVGERAEELTRAVMGLYAVGLARVVEIAAQTPVLRELVEDEVVRDLLVLHDLHPDDADTRIQAALDRVRPYLGSHAGGVEFSGVDEQGVAHLTLEGTCNGCPSSSVTVTTTLERAVLDAAPDVLAVEVVGVVAEQASPLLQIGLRPGLGPAAEDGPEDPAPRWEQVDAVPSPGNTRSAGIDGRAVLLANLSGTPYAYRDRCPACGSGLAVASLHGDVLVCPGCDAGYDVRRAGRCVDDPGQHLEPLPLLPDGSGWRVAVPRGVAVS
jgi:Fe-S cluster biogenesis protein NfuA/nitrite reductase/ring-hydroxylating ferredoxin subunit